MREGVGMPNPVEVGCGENLARIQLQDVEGCWIFYGPGSVKYHEIIKCKRKG